MATKTDVIDQISAAMGSMGSHEQAERFYEHCRAIGSINVDENGVSLNNMSVERFNQIWNIIA